MLDAPQGASESHRENAGKTLGMGALIIINPIYTLYSGYLDVNVFIG